MAAGFEQTFGLKVTGVNGLNSLTEALKGYNKKANDVNRISVALSESNQVLSQSTTTLIDAYTTLSVTFDNIDEKFKETSRTISIDHEAQKRDAQATIENAQSKNQLIKILENLKRIEGSRGRAVTDYGKIQEEKRVTQELITLEKQLQSIKTEDPALQKQIERIQARLNKTRELAEVEKQTATVTARAEEKEIKTRKQL